MPRFALLLEYDGGPFHGWQRQSGGQPGGQSRGQPASQSADQPTVQAALEAALARLDPAGPAVTGAGRTDSGVHATGQVAHVDLARAWDPFRLQGALNAHLRPHPVAVLAVAVVADDFHARFSAIERHYRFRLLCRRAPATHERGLVWQVPHRLDAAAMRAGAAQLIGRHDFTTFRAAQCQAASPVKTLDAITITETAVPGGIMIDFRLRARSFLHNQVRSIIGTLERVGAGAWTPDDVGRALAARDRAACGPVSPPQGLYLTAVRYPDPPAL